MKGKGKGKCNITVPRFSPLSVIVCWDLNLTADISNTPGMELSQLFLLKLGLGRHILKYMAKVYFPP